MARTIAYVFGAILAAIGIWGFIQNPVAGIFAANTLQSLVHLLSGALLLGVAAWTQSSSLALKLFGVVYALIAIVGLLMGGETIFGLIENSVANSVLHTLLAVIFLWVGFMGSRDAPIETSSPPPPVQ